MHDIIRVIFDVFFSYTEKRAKQAENRREAIEFVGGVAYMIAIFCFLIWGACNIHASDPHDKTVLAIRIGFVIFLIACSIFVVRSLMVGTEQPDLIEALPIHSATLTAIYVCLIALFCVDVDIVKEKDKQIPPTTIVRCAPIEKAKAACGWLTNVRSREELQLIKKYDEIVPKDNT